MWRRLKWPVALAVLIVTSLAFRGPAEKYFEVAKSLDIFATLFKEVNAYYVDEVEPEKLVRTGIDAMLESLDPYTDYISEEEMESFRISTTGQYGGVGAMIGVINKKVVITQPYKGFPAFGSGLKVGDEIIEIDGINVEGKRTSAVSALLKGQPKTDVEIKVRRYGKKDDLVFKVTRQKINVSNVAHYSLIGSDIAYIRLDDFTPGASYEVADALIELKERGAKSLILDLRENPGGLLHEAVNIVSLFIPKGMEVVSTKGKVDEWNKIYKTLNDPLDTEIPMVVLTSEGSASASEIVAGTLQDYDRAVLIGGKTFGKGLVQTTRPLSYNAQLKVTTAKYYIPSGRCIQALDYTHRNADGTVGRIPDSLKAQFKTRNGRLVYDGGGLDPDVDVDNKYLGTVTSELVDAGLIFEYASKYCGENPKPDNLEGFHISDREYEGFVKWLETQQHFNYTTSLEQTTQKLVETAKKERLYADLEIYLDGLQNKIEANKSTDYVRFRGEIKSLLEEQIAFHYDLEDGRAKVSLPRDEDILAAKSVLKDSVAYHRIFRPI
jgi:carboxyl-terminal processing protease